MRPPGSACRPKVTGVRRRESLPSKNVASWLADCVLKPGSSDVQSEWCASMPSHGTAACLGGSPGDIRNDVHQMRWVSNATVRCAAASSTGAQRTNLQGNLNSSKRGCRGLRAECFLQACEEQGCKEISLQRWAQLELDVVLKLDLVMPGFSGRLRELLRRTAGASSHRQTACWRTRRTRAAGACSPGL